VRTIFDAPDAHEVEDQFQRVVEAWATKLPEAAERLEHAREDLLALAALSLASSGARSWAPTREERLNKEIRRRTDVVEIFPDRATIIRLIASLLIGETEEWAEQRRYMSAEALAKVQRVRFAGADDGTEHALADSLTA